MATDLVSTFGRFEAAVSNKRDDWRKALKNTGTDCDRFMQGVIDAVRANPKLLDCDVRSVIMAANKAAAVGLDVSGVTGEAFLVGPLGREKRCELWRGVHGNAKLAYRSGLVSVLRPAIVREGDDFEVDLGSVDHPIVHVPRSGIGPIVAWYAIVALRTGGTLVGLVWRDEADALCDAAAARLGEAFARSPWATHPDAMLLKTAVARATKWAPKSIEQCEMLDVGDDAIDVTEHRPASRTTLTAVTEDGEVIEQSTHPPQAPAALQNQPAVPAPMSTPAEQPVRQAVPAARREAPPTAPPAVEQASAPPPRRVAQPQTTAAPQSVQQAPTAAAGMTSDDEDF